MDFKVKVFFRIVLLLMTGMGAWGVYMMGHYSTYGLNPIHVLIILVLITIGLFYPIDLE